MSPVEDYRDEGSSDDGNVDADSQRSDLLDDDDFDEQNDMQMCHEDEPVVAEVEPPMEEEDEDDADEQEEEELEDRVSAFSSSMGRSYDCDCEVTPDGYLVPSQLLPDDHNPGWVKAEDFTIVFKGISLTLLGTLRISVDQDSSIDYKGLLMVDDEAISICRGGSTNFDISDVECAVITAHHYFTNSLHEVGDSVEEQLWSKQREGLVKLMEVHFASQQGVEFLEYNPITGDVSLRITGSNGFQCKILHDMKVDEKLMRASGVVSNRRSSEFCFSGQAMLLGVKPLCLGPDIGKRRFSRYSEVGPSSVVGAAFLQTLLYAALSRDGSAQPETSAFRQGLFGGLAAQNLTFLDELTSFVHLESMLGMMRHDSDFAQMKTNIAAFITHAFDTTPADTPTLCSSQDLCGECYVNCSEVTLLPCRHLDCCRSCIPKLLSRTCTTCFCRFDSFVDTLPKLALIPLLRPHTDILSSIGFDLHTQPAKFAVDCEPPVHYAWNMIGGIQSPVESKSSGSASLPVNASRRFAASCPKRPYTRALPTNVISLMTSSNSSEASNPSTSSSSSSSSSSSNAAEDDHWDRLHFSYKLACLVYESDEILRVRRSRVPAMAWMYTAAAAAVALLPQQGFSEFTARENEINIGRDSLTRRQANGWMERLSEKKRRHIMRSAYTAHEIGHADPSLNVYENKLVLLYHLVLGEAPPQRSMSFLERQIILKLRYWGLGSAPLETLATSGRWVPRVRGLSHRCGIQVAQWLRSASVLHSLRKSLSCGIHVGFMGANSTDVNYRIARSLPCAANAYAVREEHTKMRVMHVVPPLEVPCLDGSLGNLIFISFPSWKARSKGEVDARHWGSSLINLAVILLEIREEDGSLGDMEPLISALCQSIPILCLVPTHGNVDAVQKKVTRATKSLDIPKEMVQFASVTAVEVIQLWMLDHVKSLLMNVTNNANNANTNMNNNANLNLNNNSNNSNINSNNNSSNNGDNSISSNTNSRSSTSTIMTSARTSNQILDDEEQCNNPSTPTSGQYMDESKLRWTNLNLANILSQRSSYDSSSTRKSTATTPALTSPRGAVAAAVLNSSSNNDDNNNASSPSSSSSITMPSQPVPRCSDVNPHSHILRSEFLTLLG